MTRANAPGLGHVHSGCTSSDPSQAGQQAKFIHAQTSRDTCDPCHHSETTTSSHSVTKESLTALPGPTSNGIPVTHTVPIDSFILFLIYNPPLHLVVSSLSIASCALHFAPLFFNAHESSTCYVLWITPAFQGSLPPSTGPPCIQELHPNFLW